MSHKISDFPSTTGVLRRLTCPKFVFGRGSAPDSAGGAQDAPPGCENEAKIKRLYDGETATLCLHQMGNEMKKVGNRWSGHFGQIQPNLAPAKILDRCKDWYSRPRRRLFTTESNETTFGLSSFEWLHGLIQSQLQQNKLTQWHMTITQCSINTFLLLWALCSVIIFVYYCYVLAMDLLLWYACICVLVECCCPTVQSVFQHADERSC